MSAPYPRAVEALGFPAEVAGIEGAIGVAASVWADHLEKSRAVILRGAQRAEQRRKAVILGGGLQHDVPIAELCGHVPRGRARGPHPPVRQPVGHPRAHNVRRVEADITGTISRAYAVAWDADEPLPASEPTLFLDDPEVDFTASVNLLSQLPCMPMSYLQKPERHRQEKIDEFARDLIRAHLPISTGFPAVSR